jgi:hypothetical protein
MPGVSRPRLLLTTCATLLAVALAVAVNVATGGALPSPLRAYQPWAWSVVGLLTLATVAVALLQLRHVRSAADPPDVQPVHAEVRDSGAVGQRDLHIGGQHAAGRDIHITYMAPASGTVRPPDPASASISNLPPHNPKFTGRTDQLHALRQHLTASAATAVVVGQAQDQDLYRTGEPQALYGLGGFGKTQLALEYAHRYRDNYDIRWWIPAEQPLVIAASLAALGRRLGLPERAEQEQQVADVLAELDRRDRWLLVFDNAVHPRDLTAYRPSTGRGHVIITSRNPAWGEIANPIPVKEFTRQEAVAFLLRRVKSNDQDAAAHLAEELGELPLALEQAAAYLEQTGLGLGEYLTQYRRDRDMLLGKGEPIAYGATVGATFGLAYQQVAKRSQAAAELLTLCAFLAPEQIPHMLLRRTPDQLPEALAAVTGDDGRYAETVGVLRGFSLVERDETGLRVHRLVQAVIRQQLTQTDHTWWAQRAVRVLQASWPTSSWLPAAWPDCGVLLPHATSVADHARQHDPGNAAVALLLTRVGGYLWGRGELQASMRLLQDAMSILYTVHGPHHHETLAARHNVARLTADMGNSQEALSQLRAILAVREQVLGPDHPDTLRTRHEVATAIGETDDRTEGLRLLREVLAAREQVLGPDHPETLRTRHNIASFTDDTKDALRQFHEILAVQVRVLGPDHPDTLNTRQEVALAVGEIGDNTFGLRLLREVLAAREQVLGPDHPDTLRTREHVKNWDIQAQEK